MSSGDYWGAAGFLRDADQPWFTEADVRLLTSLSGVIAAGVRRCLVNRPTTTDVVPAVDGPGVVVFDGDGNPEAISPAADHLIAQLVEEPPPDSPAESPVVRSVAARTRTLGRDHDPIQSAARARVQTRSGSWLVLYGTPLAGSDPGRIAVIIQPAGVSEVAPLVALAYGLTERERQIVRLCMEGRPTKMMAAQLHMSPYTVQDHLTSIFDKTGVRSRNELVGQVFLEHYAPRWEEVNSPTGWLALSTPPPASVE